MAVFGTSPTTGVGANIPNNPALNVIATNINPSGVPVSTDVFSNPLNANFLAQPNVTSTPI